MNENAPILEHDEGEAVIEPSRQLEKRDVPEHVVLCQLREVHARIAAAEGTRVASRHGSEAGSFDLLEVEFDGRRLGVLPPLIGAPLAAACLEEVIAVGARRFVLCGSAGALDSGLSVSRTVVVRSAVRDEGTSYHYLPASREVDARPEVVEALVGVLEERKRDHVVGKTWTTDAFYRETPARVARRRAEGCLVVEMEASALLAVARYRGVPLGCVLSAHDDVSGEEWDRRDRRPLDVRSDLFEIAAEACLRLP